MSKRITKPHVINDRLETPTGLVGVPPEAAMLGGDTYIIVTDKQTAERVINEILSPPGTASLPQ